MQRQNHWQFLDAHPFLCFLIVATIITFKFIVAAKRFRVAEATQTMCYAGILIDVHLQIEKVLVFAADRLTIQASRFAGQDALEYFMDPSWFLLWLATLTTATAIAGNVAAICIGVATSTGSGRICTTATRSTHKICSHTGKM